MKSEKEGPGGPETAAPARREVYRFGEVSVRVEGLDERTWQCSVGDATIGYVTYSSEAGALPGRKSRDYGFSGYSAASLEDAEHHPATDVNRYSSLKNAARAVVACHFGGRRYTYIHDNIAILDGKVVPESVFKGRKVIKPVLG